MTEVEKEKLIDYLFMQNDKLTSELAGVREELRLQREQSAEQHRDLQSRFDRMEECAIFAKERASKTEERVSKAELVLSESRTYTDKLNATIAALMDCSTQYKEKTELRLYY